MDLAGGAVDDLGGGTEIDAHGEHRAGADDHTLGHFAAGADEAIVLDDHGVRLQRLQHAADAGAARDMHALADLRAGADGGPGVDHRAFADMGAKVHEAGHQHHALGDKGAAPHHGAGHHANAGSAEGGIIPAGELQRHLVEGRGAGAAIVHHAIVVEAKGQQHRLLQPLVDLPATLPVRLGHAGSTGIEQAQCRIDMHAHIIAGGGNAVARLEGGFDGSGKGSVVGHRTFPEIGIRPIGRSPPAGMVRACAYRLGCVGARGGAFRPSTLTIIPSSFDINSGRLTMKRIAALLGLLSVTCPVPSFGQGMGMSEVIVTARRSEEPDYSSNMPAVGLQRTADFVLQEVTVSGDTRDKDRREAEIYDMIKGAIASAAHSGVQLAYGDHTVEPLTLGSYRGLTLQKDRQPDSEKVGFLVKAPLSSTMDARSAQARITAFVKSVKPVGRAQIEQSDDMTLSVVAPDKYRGAIADIISADAKAMAARLGDGYAVEIEGLNRPVEWARSGLSEVLLYIPYKLVIVPKR